METLEYLREIGDRMQDYDQVRGYVLSYILKHKINDSNLCTDLFCMGFLHKAYQRNEVLTEIDIAMLIGADGDEEFLDDTDYLQFLTLDEEYSNYSLLELLDYIKTKNQC
jgi:hypothetical protein